MSDLTLTAAGYLANCLRTHSVGTIEELAEIYQITMENRQGTVVFDRPQDRQVGFYVLDTQEVYMMPISALRDRTEFDTASAKWLSLLLSTREGRARAFNSEPLTTEFLFPYLLSGSISGIRSLQE